MFAVVVGTLFDVYHKGSAKFFAQRTEKSEAAAPRRLSGGETFSLALETIADAAISGEFCQWPAGSGEPPVGGLGCYAEHV